jgi:hypothetical protein
MSLRIRSTRDCWRAAPSAFGDGLASDPLRNRNHGVRPPDSPPDSLLPNPEKTVLPSTPAQPLRRLAMPQRSSGDVSARMISLLSVTAIDWMDGEWSISWAAQKFAFQWLPSVIGASVTGLSSHTANRFPREPTAPGKLSTKSNKAGDQPSPARQSCGGYAASIVHCRHKTIPAVVMSDGIVSIRIMKLYLCQWVTMPGNY